jgi:hypothetical protein
VTVDSLTVAADVQSEWAADMAKHREAELERIITDEHLKPEPTRYFIDVAFKSANIHSETGAVPTAGTEINRIPPPASQQESSGDRRDQATDSFLVPDPATLEVRELEFSFSRMFEKCLKS